MPIKDAKKCPQHDAGAFENPMGEGSSTPNASVGLIWLHLVSEQLNEQRYQLSKEHTVSFPT